MPVSLLRRPADNLGMPIRKDYGKLIADAREAKQWSQSRLAKEAGISQPSLSAIEAGDTQPDQVKLDTIWRVTSALGIALEPFMAEGAAIYNVEERPPPRARLPLISFVIAGNRSEANDPYAPGAAEAWIDFDSMASKSAFCLRVRGTSMIRPDGTGFPDGCFIAVFLRPSP